MLPEQDAFIKKLYHENFRKLMIYVMSVVKNQNRAQDIVQDTFHEAVKHIDTLMVHENPGGWLMVTAKYKIRENERAQTRYLHRFLSLDSDIPENTLYAEQNEIQVEEASAHPPIELIKHALTPDEFKLLVRFTFDGASHLDIAKEFGITVYASQKRLERIRKKLYEVFPDRKKKN